MKNEHAIVCDNDNCDYKVVNKSGDPNIDISGYLNKRCPECGKNLLTKKDYEDSLKLLKAINWLNKWFSWATLFTKEKKRKTVTAHVHNGINIDDKSEL